MQSTRNKRKVVIDSDDDDTEAQSNARRITTFGSSSPTDAIRSTCFFTLIYEISNLIIITIRPSQKTASVEGDK